LDILYSHRRFARNHFFVPVVIDVGVQHAFHIFGGDVAFGEALGEILGF
jgi:hypothetical protein